MVDNHKQEKNKNFKPPKKEEQWIECSDWKAISKICKKKKWRKTEKKFQYFHKLQTSNDEDQKNILGVAESIGRWEILFSTSKWNLGAEKGFKITCLTNSTK